MLTQLSIKEIKQLVSQSASDELMELLRTDERKGVQQLYKRVQKQREERRNELARYEKMSTYERKLKSEGKTWIAGVDEVGRGCLAGPVVAACVILPNEPILGLYDSKRLSASRREALSEQIRKKGTVGIGIITPEKVDKYNIYEATKMAMSQAIQSCSETIDHVLIDAMELPIPIEQTSITQGDQKSISIAAASIIAKVKRDEIMKQLAETYPQYGFERNVGYGTQEHLLALKKFGATREHRYSFSPVSKLDKDNWSEAR